MLILIIFYIICPTILLIVKNKESGLKASCFVIFLFAAFRYNFGSDYESNYILFQAIINEDVNLYDINLEVGWYMLCLIFKPFGYYALVAFWSALYVYSLYKIIHKYIPSKYYWLVIMGLLSITSLFFITLSALRQGVAISLLLLAIPYITNQKPIKYFSIIFIASLFHQSAIILLIIYPLYYLRNNKKIISAIMVALYLLLMFFGDKITPQLNIIVTKYSPQKYSYFYVEQQDYGLRELDSSIITKSIWFTFFILFLYTRSLTNNKEIKLIVLVAILATYLAQLRVAMPQRYNMYFMYFFILTVPYVIICLKKNKSKTYYSVVYTLFIAWYLKQMITMLLDPIAGIQNYHEYHTIFSLL